MVSLFVALSFVDLNGSVNSATFPALFVIQRKDGRVVVDGWCDVCVLLDVHKRVMTMAICWSIPRLGYHRL